MDTVVNAGSNDFNANAGSEGNKTQTPETVAYDSHKKLLDQHKASQKKAADLQAALDAANAEKVAAEETRLANEKKFEELYAREKAKADKLQSDMQSMSAKQIEVAKREAITAALGGVRKSDYTRFFDLSLVHLNDDGTADAESAKAAANKFREAYPELVAVKSAPKMANEAATTFQPAKPKDPKDMSVEELRIALRTVKL